MPGVRQEEEPLEPRGSISSNIGSDMRNALNRCAATIRDGAQLRGAPDTADTADTAEALRDAPSTAVATVMLEVRTLPHAVMKLIA